ncbi:hypothetical protein E2C01_098130 [Portunus trituberculatus]|uniref:Uncharacterized protein n=1 Tax=Portunus trituberculatus TaxID=210409 RepID=A0A5B7K0G7_PORTR|nr:hypothetical protein [Portunus trituberculatus]
MIVTNGEGLEWDVNGSVMDKLVKCMGLSEWRNKMEQKSTFRVVVIEAPMAQCMDVNARSYKWSEGKVSQMCDMGEDE